MNGLCSNERLELALFGLLNDDEESTLHLHLKDCELCFAEMERLSGGERASREIAAMLMPDDLDDALPLREACSTADFVVDHLEPSDDPAVLGRLGGYDVLDIIGRGGMGVVLKGFDRELKRFVAIKALAPHLAYSALSRKRFAREAQAAAAVVNLHVIAIHQVQPNGPLPFLVMPLLTGESLAQRLKARGTLELNEILRIGMQAAEGLAAAHGQGLIHRDVKPANILLEKGVERAVLTDFGLARAADDVSMTRQGIIAGTPEYMSPEQARGEALDGRSDLFSLGCVLYEMATGVSPFRTDSTMATLRRIVDEQPAAMASLVPELRPWFCHIVERLLSKDPAQRFASAGEVSQLLEQCLSHLQQPTSVPLPASLVPHAAGRRSMFNVTRKGVLAMLGTVGMALLGMVLWQATEAPDIAGRWTGEGWGHIVLKQIDDGELQGTFSETVGKESGVIQLKWSRIERQYNGTWKDGDDRFGELSIRLVGDEIRGAHTTDAKSKVNPATPRLAYLAWSRDRQSPSEGQGDERRATTSQEFGAISGTLIDERTAKPVAGAIVACSPVLNEKGGGARATTDAQGRYLLERLSPGIYNVWLKQYTNEARATAIADDGLQVEAGNVSLSSLVLVTGKHVVGKVLDSSGNPVVAKQVGCYSTARPNSAAAVQSATTKDDGSFEFYLPPGRAHLYFMHDGLSGEDLTDSKRLTIPDAGTVSPVTLVLRRFEGQLGAADWLEQSTPGTKLVSRPGQQDVTGTVVDHTGRPVPNASVFRSDGRIVKTDAEGKFLIPTLSREQFVMNVAAPSFHVWTGMPSTGDVLTVALEPKQNRDEQRDHVVFAIDGEWELVELVVDGTKVEVAGRDMKVVVQYGHLTYFYGGKDQTKFAKFRILSLVVADGPSVFDAQVVNGLGRDRGQVFRGIYELKGDDLRICLPDKADVARPPRFESPPGSALQLLRLRRVAAQPAQAHDKEVHKADAPQAIIRRLLQLNLEGGGWFPSVHSSSSVDTSRTIVFQGKAGKVEVRAGESVLVELPSPVTWQCYRTKSDRGTTAGSAMGVEGTQARNREGDDLLDGVWELIPPPGIEKNRPEGHRLVFAGDWYAMFQGSKRTFVSRIKIEPQHTPKRISGGRDFGLLGMHGIYQLDNEDTLRLMIVPTTATLPTQFRIEHPKYTRVKGKSADELLDALNLYSKQAADLEKASRNEVPGGVPRFVGDLELIVGEDLRYRTRVNPELRPVSLAGVGKLLSDGQTVVIHANADVHFEWIMEIIKLSSQRKKVTVTVIPLPVAALGATIPPEEQPKPEVPTKEYGPKDWAGWFVNQVQYRKQQDGSFPTVAFKHLRKWVIDDLSGAPNAAGAADARAWLETSAADKNWTEAEFKSLVEQIGNWKLSVIQRALPGEGTTAKCFPKPGRPATAAELRDVRFGPAAENGLRVAWVFTPVKQDYAIGDNLPCRVMLHNSGSKPVQFVAWDVLDGVWTIHNAAGKPIKMSDVEQDIRWSLPTMANYQRYRLAPGQVVEIHGKGIGIGEAAHATAKNQEAIGRIIHASVGDSVRISVETKLDLVHRSGELQFDGFTFDEFPEEKARDWSGTLRSGEVKFNVVAATAKPSNPTVSPSSSQ